MSRPIVLAARIGASLAAFAGAALSADVRIVGGGQGIPTIQEAVFASAPGDIVLVKSGTYGGFTISGVPLTVTADAGQNVVLSSSVNVTNIPAGAVVTLAGLNTSSTLSATNVSGSLRVLGCSIVTSSGFNAVTLTSCADAAFSNCTLQSGTGSTASGAGLSTNGGKLDLDHCTLVGGDGPPGQTTGFGNTAGGPGGPGLLVSGAQVFLSGCQLAGGSGGPGVSGSCTSTPFPSPGGAGGAGLQANAAAVVRSLATTSAGGVGGWGGTGFPGTCTQPDGAPGAAVSAPAGVVVSLPGASRWLRPTQPVRAGSAWQLQIDGQIGDRVYLAVSAGADHAFVPALSGVQLFASPPRRVFVGTIGATGSLTASLPVGNLPAGLVGVARQVQAVAVDSAGQGWLATATQAVLLDASL